MLIREPSYAVNFKGDGRAVKMNIRQNDIQNCLQLNFIINSLGTELRKWIS